MLSHDELDLVLRSDRDLQAAEIYPLELGEVLMLGGEKLTIGKPYVAGAKVSAEIVAQGRDKKVIVFKINRRKRYRRKNGHRQPYTELKITGISA